MSRQPGLSRINGSARATGTGVVPAVRLLLALGWVLAATGYCGPWIAHMATALALTGVDMGEFVKFLPQVLDGSLALSRQLFYLPPVAVVVSTAWLVGARQLAYPWQVRLAFLALAVLTSLQLLPPAWSPASLATAEFRLQAIGLATCWLLLAGFWLWSRLPLQLTGSLAALSALTAGGMSAWVFRSARPAIDQVYRSAPPLGWGFFVCLAGLAMISGASLAIALQGSRRKRVP